MAKSKTPAVTGAKRSAPDAAEAVDNSKLKRTKSAAGAAAAAAAPDSAADAATSHSGQKFEYRKIGRPTWFELHVPKPELVLEFYREVFGWNVSRFEPEGTPYKRAYYVAMSEPFPSDGLQRKGINGGITDLTHDHCDAKSQTLLSISVDNLEETLKAVKENGGFEGRRYTVPTVGEYAYCYDAVGFPFYVMQEAPSDCTPPGPDAPHTTEGTNRVMFCEWHISPSIDIEKTMFPFYAKTFGWTHMPWTSHFSFAMTGPGPVSEWGGINGGLAKMRDSTRSRIVPMIEVKDLAKTTKDIEKAGGSIVQNKTAVPGHGWFSYFEDPQGLRAGIWQEDKLA